MGGAAVHRPHGPLARRAGGTAPHRDVSDRLRHRAVSDAGAVRDDEPHGPDRPAAPAIRPPARRPYAERHLDGRGAAAERGPPARNRLTAPRKALTLFRRHGPLPQAMTPEAVSVPNPNMRCVR